MALLPILDSIDSLPEALREHYRKDGDRFVLDVTPTDGWKLDDISTLEATLTKERKARKDAESSLKAWSKLGEDPDEIAAKLKDADGSKGATPKDLEERIRAEREKMQAAFEKEKQAMVTERDKARTKLQQTLLERSISEGLAEHRLAKGGAKAIRSLIRERLRVVEDGDDFRVVVLDEDGNEAYSKRSGSAGKHMTVAEAIDGVKDELPSLFEASDTRGTGTKPGSGSGLGGGPKIDLNDPRADLIGAARNGQ